MKESVRDPSDQIFCGLSIFTICTQSYNSNLVQVKLTSYANCLEPLSCVVRPNVLIELVIRIMKYA